MPRRDWAIRVRDIIEAAEKIVSHTKGLDFEAFSGDDWAVDAVLRNLTVIGEAARHMPGEFMAAHPEVPWADMSDMRNIVVHEYFGVDLSIIWSTIREDLPPLIDQLKTIMEKEGF